MNLTNQLSNKKVISECIEKYQKSTKNAVESILCMGEAVYEIYKRKNQGQLSEAELEYFCNSVNLKQKGSTFRKYKIIGQNANRFRECMNRLPATFTVLYEMATLNGEDFERFVAGYQDSKNVTLEEFKELIKNSTVSTKNKICSATPMQFSKIAVAKLIRKINQFNISIMRDVPESKFNEIVEILTKYTNEGYIRFDHPEIYEYSTEVANNDLNTKLLNQDVITV